MFKSAIQTTIRWFLKCSDVASVCKSLWTFGGTYRSFCPFTCSHFCQTRLNQNIHNTIYHNTGLVLQHCVHFPQRTTARGDVASQPKLMTSQNISQDRSLQRLFRARNIRLKSGDCFEVGSQMCPPLSDILFHMLVFTAMFLLILPSSHCNVTFLSWTSTLTICWVGWEVIVEGENKRQTWKRKHKGQYENDKDI